MLWVLVETRCTGQTLGPQLAGNKPRCVTCIIVSVFCLFERWSTPDPHILRARPESLDPSSGRQTIPQYRGVLRSRGRRFGHLQEGRTDTGSRPERLKQASALSQLRNLTERKERVTTLEAPLLEVAGDVPDEAVPERRP